MRRPVFRSSVLRSPLRVLATVTVALAAVIGLLWLGLTSHPPSSLQSIGTPSSNADLASALQLGNVDVAELIKVLKVNGLLMEKSPPALPSTQLEGMSPEEAKNSFKRGPFGGRGDPVHLGGFVTLDPLGLAPALWEYMVKVINVKSMVDVGCGRGKNTNWFLEKGVDVLCVEGSHDAVSRSFLPPDRIVEHDFSRGPWWPDKTYDVAFSIEFLEHVSRQYMDNYFPIFKRSAIVVATHAMQIGYHHVEVHMEDWWWRSRFAARGLVFSPELTTLFRDICAATGQGKWYRQSVEVYINPLVASRPEHAHLFGGGGCLAEVVDERNATQLVVAPCAGPDELPARFKPVWAGAAEGSWKSKERPEARAMTSGYVKASAFAGH